MKRTTLVLAALVLGAVVPETRAGFIQQYASTSISWDADTAAGARDVGGSNGISSVSKTITVQDIFGDTATVSASASSNISTWVLETQADVKENDPFLDLGLVPSRGAAEASWQDILFLSSTDPNVVGQTLRLSFTASGSLLLQNGSQYLVQKSVSTDAGPLGPSNTSVLLQNGQSRFWDTLATSRDSYAGTFHVDVPISTSGGGLAEYISGIPGSIYFKLDATEVADTFVGPGDGPVETAVSDPFQFVSITLPDEGNVTPESLGVSVTFDSGLISPNLLPSASAVPEPASLTLLGLGGLCLGGYSWRRRKAAHPAA